MKQELFDMLREAGAAKIGVADLTVLPPEQAQGYTRGIAMLLPIDPTVVARIPDGPLSEYGDQYVCLNYKLDELGTRAERFLQQRGYRAFAQNRDLIKWTPDNPNTALPHKTVCRLAGLGWIGKPALFLSREFGSAQRLTTVLTDAPLEADSPSDEDGCGDCMECKKVCPGDAVTGKNWRLGMDREEIFRSQSCLRAVRHRSETLARDLRNKSAVCGLCIAACPHTKRYLRSCGIDVK